MKVLVTELPWLGKKYAGRSGMRWAHTSNKSPIISFRPFPFYLGTAAAAIENAGHTVKVIDALAEQLSEDEYYNQVQDFKPDFILAEIHTPSYNNDKQIMRKLKKLTNAQMIWAGPHPTAVPDNILKENEEYADYVMVSEFEFTSLDVIEGGVQNGIVRPNEMADINKIPWPARHLFKMNLYNEVFCREYPNVQLMASRGCPFRCSYCNIYTMSNFTRRQRCRDVKDVVDEMEFIIKEYNPKELYLDDDIINGNQPWLVQLMDEKINRGVDIPFTCMGHVSIRSEVLEKMKQAGCQGMKLGIESANNEVLRRLGKGITREMSIRTLEKCRELGIRTHCTFCIGLPGDTEETVRDTIAFAKKYTDHFQVSIAAPLPATPLWDEAIKEGWIDNINWDEFDGMEDAIIHYPTLPPEVLKKIADGGQASTYIQVLRTGEWKKYLKMIYAERGVPGIAKLILYRGPEMIKDVIKTKFADASS